MTESLIRLAFVGDVCLNFFRHAPIDISEFAGWPDIKDKIGNHDLLVGNLECCFVDDSCSDNAKRNRMAVPATAGTFLEETGFTDLCLANNHTMDCGPGALAVTRECLASHGIRGFGAGANLDEAEAAVFVDCNGRKIAFLAACDQSELYAAPGQAGVARLTKKRLGQKVRKAAAQADLVVVTLHADLEFSDVPGGWRRRLCRWLIKQGAHLVIQHHPHVLQGIERYHGGVIAYSLGNFIFQLRGNPYQERRAGVSDSMVLVVEASFAGAKPEFAFRVVPLRIGMDHLPSLVADESYEREIRRNEVLSTMVSDRRFHRRAWFRRCRAEASVRMQRIYYAGRRGHFARGVRELGRLLGSREDRRWLLGLASFGYL